MSVTFEADVPYPTRNKILLWQINDWYLHNYNEVKFYANTIAQVFTITSKSSKSRNVWKYVLLTEIVPTLQNFLQITINIQGVPE